MTATTAACCGLGFREFRDHALGGQQQTRDAGRVLQGRARYFGRIEHAVLHQICHFACGHVVSHAALGFFDFLDHQSAFKTGVFCQLTQRILKGT